MTGRILVVDDILANLKLLEARLSAEYFDVLTAETGRQALAILEKEPIDVVLLDVMMPGLNGFDVCRRIKQSPTTMHVPVILVTALNQPSDKMQGLEAGADDFLTKPVQELALLTRVKNLARLKSLNDEMALRVANGTSLGLGPSDIAASVNRGGRLLLVEDDEAVAAQISQALGAEHTVEVESDIASAQRRLTEAPFDLLVASLALKSADGLRLCGQLRGMPKMRHLPIIVLIEPGDDARLLRGFDIGVNDYLTRPVDRNELLARVRTQLKRKRYADHLRETLDESVEMALTDALTGLHNRRFLETHLRGLIEQGSGSGKPLSLLIADIDHFKAINDTWGHDGGDAVLREIAVRLRRDTRTADVACRLGGEEFVVVMPDTDLDTARVIGERLRDGVASAPFQAAPGVSINVTLSVGLSTFHPGDTAQSLTKRADLALYAAKNKGRNRVVAEAA